MSFSDAVALERARTPGRSALFRATSKAAHAAERDSILVRPEFSGRSERTLGYRGRPAAVREETRAFLLAAWTQPDTWRFVEGLSMPQTAVTSDAGAPAGAAERSATASIVFFDGVCGLCNATVQFCLARDHHGRLLFAPLQGETAARLLPAEYREDLSTMVLRTETDRLYLRSAAAVRILWRLGGGWRLLGALLWLVPLPLRDVGYRLFAASRYRLFGRHDTCRLPTPQEAGRVLP
jgi:predicted DCC family thiol-disulfide oxidoreductase YuxK